MDITAGIIGERSHIRKGQHVLSVTAVLDGAKMGFAIVSFNFSSIYLSYLSVFFRRNLSYMNMELLLFLLRNQLSCLISGIVVKSAKTCFKFQHLLIVSL